MGNVAGVGFDSFPEQGGLLMKRVEVCFNYDTTRAIGGYVVRDDRAAPGHMIIRLDDCRHVLSVECQFRVLEDF